MQPLRSLTILLASAVAPIAASHASAGVDAEVMNGDKISGTISPATEIEVFRVTCPQGAVLTAKAKSGRGDPDIRVRLRDEGGTVLGDVSGRSVTVGGVAIGGSGVYRVEVTSDLGVTPGDYSLAISWKAQGAFPGEATLGGGEETSVAFAADAAGSCRFAVKKAKGSAAEPVIVRLTGPDGFATTFAAGVTSGTAAIATSGDHALVVRNDGAAAGAVTISIKVRSPKASKRKVDLRNGSIGAQDGAYVVSNILGPDGGSFVVPAPPFGEPGGAIAGSAIDVPQGALPAGTAIYIGTSPEFDPRGLVPAGPPVFFGPDGLKFVKPFLAQLTIPIAPGITDSALVQVFTEDARGRVSLVPPPYTFDLVAHTVSFFTDHFSAFRAGEPGTSPDDGLVTTIGTGLLPEDLSFVRFPSAARPNDHVYVAEGNASVVGVLVAIDLDAGLFQHEVFAGGGNLTADGTHRLQFRFDDPVTSVVQVGTDSLFVATTTQIFHIQNDLVARFAGTGNAGDSGDFGPARNAEFTRIEAILAMQGEILVADGGAARIRRITGTSTMAPFAGTGVAGIGIDGEAHTAPPLFSVTDIAQASATAVYVADGGRVRILDRGDIGRPEVNVTVAGATDGSTGSTGDGLPPLSARFDRISGIAAAAAGRLIVSDAQDHTIRVVDFPNDVVTTLLGEHGEPGDLASDFAPPGNLDTPGDIDVFGGSLFFAEFGNGRIRRVGDAP